MLRLPIPLLFMFALCFFGSWSAQAGQRIRHVIVIVMENANGAKAGEGRYIYGNSDEAPYINNVLMPSYAHALNFNDPVRLALPSEPHYIYLEAGTNSFADFTFDEGITGDFDPSAKRSTASKEHLTEQMRATKGRVTWMAYQEGMSEVTGACPVNSDYKMHYAAKHNPFVFFKDVAGDPPAKNNAYCAAHMRPFKALKADMVANRLADYVFITPNLCHDMHNTCGSPSRISNGDRWLETEMPAMISWAKRNDGVIFLTFDEGNESHNLPFIAIGPHVKEGYAGAVAYDHGSIIKTVERIFGLPYLATVAAKHDLSDLFKPGAIHRP